MENIDILNAELDLIEAAQKQNVELLTKDLDNILNNYFVTPVESVVARRFIKHGCWSKDVEFYFEIGFYNPEENRIDFGSDTSFEYNSNKRELSVNHGCCGSFTKKNIYQFKRALLIAEVYKKELYREYIHNVGFDYLYDKSGLYDTLRGVVEDKQPAEAITWTCMKSSE